ncbi:MAG: hypothetical protein PHS55_05240, partial [Firmicutes bacterium]|nr:hypothetical protein [Bacillota bacterium]
MSGWNQFRAVYRTLLNLNFSISHSRETYLVQKKRLWEPILIVVSLGVAGAMLITAYVKLLNMMYDNAAALGQGNMILTLAIVLGQVIVLLLGLFWVISVFYFSDDSAILTPLPIPASTVILAKFGVLMVNEYITLAFFLIPAFAVYGIRTAAGALYWIAAVVVFLIVPMLPLAVSSIVSVILMRFVNVRKSRTFFMVLGSVLFFGAYFWFQYYTMHTMPQTQEGIAQYIMTVQDSLSKTLATKFPPGLWASTAVSKAGTLAGTLNFLLLAAVSLGALVVLLAVASKLFYAGLTSGGEVVARKGRSRDGARPASTLAWTRRSPEVAIALKDMWVFLRTPTFALNGVANAIIFPGLMAVWFLVGGGQNPFSSIPEFAAFMAAPEFASFHALVLAAMIMWSAGSNMVGASAFSREGSQLWMLKIVPVEPARQVLGKALFALAFNVVAAVPMIVVLQLILRLSWLWLVFSILLGLLGTVWTVFLNVQIDMWRPYLTWDNPQRAMKNNINGLIGWIIV